MVKPPTVAGLTLNVGQVLRKVKFRNNLSSSLRQLFLQWQLLWEQFQPTWATGMTATEEMPCSWPTLPTRCCFLYSWLLVLSHIARLICPTWIRPFRIINTVQEADNDSIGKCQDLFPNWVQCLCQAGAWLNGGWWRDQEDHPGDRGRGVQRKAWWVQSFLFWIIQQASSLALEGCAPHMPCFCYLGSVPVKSLGVLIGGFNNRQQWICHQEVGLWSHLCM